LDFPRRGFDRRRAAAKSDAGRLSREKALRGDGRFSNYRGLWLFRVSCGENGEKSLHHEGTKNTKFKIMFIRTLRGLRVLRGLKGFRR
jgi:hypothetical protein